MYQIDFKKPLHIYFMGIGGISMSGLAEILLKEHFKVTGSDTKESSLTMSLSQKGATIFYGQRTSNITKDIEVVVYTAAIPPTNPEYITANELNIPMITRAELLGQLMLNYETPIAISGTHGKTTTTSMISQILLAADLDPTLSIGGIFKAINGNIRVGNSGYFLTEACEYTNSFLSFHPKISIILNIEEDHLDFFKDIHHILESFHQFAKLIPSDGTLIINGDIEHFNTIIEGLSCNIITYGSDSSNDYSSSEIVFDEFARPTYTLLQAGVPTASISLGVTGMHNVSNSLAAIALSNLLEIPLNTTQKGLQEFIGTERRFEYKGKIGGITIIDDYAHHPTEIIATLETAKKYPHKTIWCVFQPHTYTRTKNFLLEFAQALTLADKVILADIFASRETETLGMHSQMLETEIEKLGTECYYFPSFDEIENFLLEKCINGDMLITIGAGDVYIIGENILGI